MEDISFTRMRPEAICGLPGALSVLDAAAEVRPGDSPEGPGGGRRPPPRFKTTENKVILDRSGIEPLAVVLSECRCGCRTCGGCGPAMGWRVRQNLLARAPDFRLPALFTLTIDRKRFASAEEAHRVVSDGKYVARLLGLLGVKRWVWVLEFQQKTGEGWPHWHVLIDKADLPRRGRVPHYLDLEFAWEMWRDRWGLGGLDLAPKKESKTVEHAIYYLTKYVTKMPDGGFPEWVLLAGRKIRFVQGCRRLGALVAKPGKKSTKQEDDTEQEDDKQENDNKPMRPLIDRMARCGVHSRAFAVGVDRETGEQVVKFVGVIPAARESLELWSRSEDFIPGKITCELVNGRPSYALSGTTADCLREALEGHRGGKFVEDHTRWRIEHQRQHLLERNAYRMRRLASEQGS